MNDFWLVRLPAQGFECSILVCGKLEDVQTYMQNIFNVIGRFEQVTQEAANIFILNGFKCYLAPKYAEDVEQVTNTDVE